VFARKQINDWSYYYLPELQERGVTHGFFTRRSPVPKLFSEPDNQFLKHFGMKDAVIMDQEHGDAVHVIEKGERPLKGDGLILVERGVAGIIKTADCLAIILIEPDYPMAAIVHAGWRGTATKIAAKAVEKMAKLGAHTDSISALFGPCIRSCCYEVGEEVYGTYREQGFSDAVFKKKDGSWYLDLARANRELLLRLGVDRIYDTGFCTFCADDMFASYRRGERTTRQINFVSLNG